MRLTTHGYSPSILNKIIRSAARQPSFADAADALEELAEVTISSRQLGRIAQEFGYQLGADRDQQVQQFLDKQLPPTVATRAALAVVEVDGGRLQIRGEGDGPGAHNASWREDKFALLATAAITVADCDPEPELPDCFRDRNYVEGLVRGIAGQSSLSGSDPPPECPADSTPAATKPPNPTRKRPELLVRTYVASMRCSEDFGPMVAAEAQRRNFTNAVHRAFVGDGSAWIWKLQKQHFPTFQAIVDFLHVLGHVFAAAKATATETEERWVLFQEWADACWKGKVGSVIESLRNRLEPIPADQMTTLTDDDPRQVLAEEIGYLQRNQPRMDYPSYRREGLPWTSSHIESTVKIFNRRVKGSEKFWSEPGAEAILQLRAAFLCEDDRLAKYQKSQPCSPFRTYKAREVRRAA